MCVLFPCASSYSDCQEETQGDNHVPESVGSDTATCPAQTHSPDAPVPDQKSPWHPRHRGWGDHPAFCILPSALVHILVFYVLNWHSGEGG